MIEETPTPESEPQVHVSKPVDPEHFEPETTDPYGPPGPLGKVKVIEGEDRENVKRQIRLAAANHGIPGAIFLAQMLYESGSTLNPRILGDFGIYDSGPASYGIGQVNKYAHPDFDIHRAFGFDNGAGHIVKPADVEYELEYSAKLLADLHSQHGSWPLALQYYNGSGQQAVNYAHFILAWADRLAKLGIDEATSVIEKV